MNSNNLSEIIRYDPNTKASLSEGLPNETNKILTPSEGAERDLNMMVDEMVELYLKLLNEGKDSRVRKQHVLNYLSNHNITWQKIYDWLLNNQNKSNNVFLLGYFNYYRIEKKSNPELAFHLFMSIQNHILALYYIGACHLYGYGTTKNEKLAFECYRIIANKNYAIGQTKMGYLYENGIGVDKNEKMAADWYRKGADNESLLAAYNLARCFKYGKGVEINCKKAFDLYLKAANIENGLAIAQYDLAEMYEKGEGTVKDINQAIYWYEKSVEYECRKAQIRLKKLLRIKMNQKRKESCKIN
jgi:hypothetical protein